MPNLTSPLGTNNAGIPLFNQVSIGKLAGAHMHFPSSAAFQAAVTAEQSNVTASSGVWADGQTMTIAGEPAVVKRVWSTSLNHARTLILNSSTSLVLSNAASAVTAISGGLPSGGTSGDVAVNYTAGVYFVKAGVEWGTPIPLSFARSSVGTVGRRVGVLGDSISANAILDPSPTPVGGVNGWAANSYITWLRRYLGYGISLSASNVFAISSATVGQPYSGSSYPTNTVIDSQLQPAVAANLDVAIIHMGTNSIGSTDTATLIYQFKLVYDTLMANGTYLVVVPIRVRGPSVQWNTSAKRQQWAQINDWIGKYAILNSRRMRCVEVNQILMDFSTGNAKTGMYADDLHDNSLSAQVMGSFIADAVKDLLTPAPGKFLLPQDTYDAVNNPGGNLIPNGLFSGTGGNSSVNGSTGVAADGWALGRNNGGSTVSITGSVVPDATYTGMQNQVVTFGGTPDNSTSFLSYEINAADVSVGDVLVFEVEVIGALTSNKLGGLTAVLAMQDSGYAGLATSYDGSYQSLFGALPSSLGSFYLRTEPIVVPPNVAHVVGSVFFQPVGTGTISGSLQFRNASLRKVI